MSRPAAAAPGPVAAAFVVFGMFWGSWAVVLADVKSTFALSDGTIGILLAVAIALAGVAGGVLGHHADRFGTTRMLEASLVAWAVLLVITSAARTFTVFALAFVAAEVAGGCIDTAMNAASSGRLRGRPGALVRLHALYNTGALGGAALAGVLLHAGLSWRWLWPGLAGAAVAVAVWTRQAAASPERRPSDLPDAPAEMTAASIPAERRGPFGRLRADGLLFFLLVFVLAEVTEGGVDTWGVLFLRTELAAGVLLGAGAYVVGQAVAAVTRGGGGPLLGMLSARAALVLGGTVAAAGILLESLAPQAVVAACGLAIGAGGASLFWPLVMSEATTVASFPTRAAGAFTAAGYMGLVAGAPLVGWVADSWGLDRGLQVLAASALAVAICALGGRRRRVRRAASG